MIHIGIIGGGNISETHARAARETEGVEITAICGPNEEKIARLCSTYGGVAYDGLDRFLSHKPMDMVMMGSPSGLHAEQGIAASQHGLHILVEKPIDVSTRMVDELIAACESAKVKLGVCFQDRFAPQIVQLKELVEKGVLGKPILVSAHVKWYRPPDYYSGSRWRGTFNLDGGGALMNQGIHTVDLLLWLMGNVERVNAVARTALHDIRVEDTLVATLEFANGAIGTLEAATSVYPGFPRRVELTGAEGTLILEHDRLVRADLRNAIDLPPAQGDTNQSASSPVVSDVRGHREILKDFLQAMATDSSPRCDGREGRRSVALVEAIYESARTGTAVELSN